jgi:hypothetical protein
MKQYYTDIGEMSEAEIKAYFDRSECFICRDGPRRNRASDNRSALLSHFRRSQDLTHKLFRKTEYNKYVKRGGDRIDRTVQLEDVQKAVKEIFPSYEFKVYD